MAIYPSITSITPGGWRKKLEEIKNLGIEEFCLFPTALDQAEREELYQELRKIKIKKIPLIHLKNEMDKAEVQKIKQEFPVGFFNIHATGQYVNVNDYSERKQDIFVENLSDWLPESALEGYRGLCLDVSHLEEQKRLGNIDKYNQVIKILENYKCEVAHISEIREEKFWHEKIQRYCFSTHTYNDLRNFDYLRQHKKYLPNVVALELENSIAEQLVAKEYIEKLLAGE